jgi:hypothetical protein
MESPISDNSLYHAKFSPAVPKITHSQRLTSRSRNLLKITQRKEWQQFQCLCLCLSFRSDNGTLLELQIFFKFCFTYRYPATMDITLRYLWHQEASPTLASAYVTALPTMKQPKIIFTCWCKLERASEINRTERGRRWLYDLIWDARKLGEYHRLYYEQLVWCWNKTIDSMITASWLFVK